jgi:cathepsin L
VNWKDSGCVNPVSDQGDCVAGWAFAASASMDGVQCVNSKSLLNLSVQQFVDCSTAAGNNGCSSGTFENAWLYASLSPIESMDDYAWTGVQNTCQADTTKGKMKTQKDSQYKRVTSNTTDMIDAIATSPAAVNLDASSYLFKTYSSGVLTSPLCGTE